MGNPYQKYKQTAILSASPEQLLIMLYEGAIRFTKLAIMAAKSNNVPERGKNILRAYDIVLELQASLDHKVGGDLPRQLDELYFYLQDRYTKANMTGDVASLESCQLVLENLYDGWKVVVEKNTKSNDQKGGAA